MVVGRWVYRWVGGCVGGCGWGGSVSGWVGGWAGRVGGRGGSVGWLGGPKIYLNLCPSTLGNKNNPKALDPGMQNPEIRKPPKPVLS